MMAFKERLLGGRLRADAAGRTAPGDREPANQSKPREAGGQRGAVHPGDPNIEVNLLDNEDGRRPGGWRSGTAIVAALAVFLGVLWYAYDWGMGQLETVRLPVIAADTAPIKSRPESPGGLVVPNRNVTVLNDVTPDPEMPQVERLLPPPELPLLAQAEAPLVEPVLMVEELLGPPLQTAAGLSEKMPANEEAQSPAEFPVAAPVAAPVAPPAAPQLAAAAEPDLPGPKAAAVQIPAAPWAAPVAAPVAAPAAAPVAAPAAATNEPLTQIAALPDAKTGGFVVQLASLRAKAGARPAWARILKDHPALLGERVLAIQQVDLGDRGIFYRVQAGFFVARAEARALCDALKARGQDCLVVKR